MLITVMIAPAVLVSGAGLMIMGAVARYSRIVDRIHKINDQLLGESSDAEGLVVQRRMFALRAHRAWLAVVLLHCAVLTFVLESLLLGLGPGLVLLQDAVLVAGMLFFGGASLLLVSEATIAFRTTEYEIERTDLFRSKK